MSYNQERQPKFTKRELVESALLKGKEQSTHYNLQLPVVNIYGTAAVKLLDGQFRVLIMEIHDPSRTDDYEFDVDESHNCADLAAVETLLWQWLEIVLSDLGPSKGNKHFH